MCLFINNSNNSCCVQSRQNFNWGIIDCNSNKIQSSIKFDHTWLSNNSGQSHINQFKHNADFYVAITTDTNPNSPQTPNRLMLLNNAARQIDINGAPIQISAKLMCKPNHIILHFFICEL